MKDEFSSQILKCYYVHNVRKNFYKYLRQTMVMRWTWLSVLSSLLLDTEIYNIVAML